MKNSIYLILFFLIIGFACEEKEDPATACGVSDPIENLPWLKQWVSESTTSDSEGYSYIKQAIFKNETVFFWGSCCPNCDWGLVLRDCSGIEIEGDYNFENLKDQKVIWRPENSQCVFK
ncbi:hypothetical protein [Algoriphagus aquimarinus]|uniref:Lipoprotein n=1 Tax=Algoriphagus aquimarinus TaxID=237018 RepID=A0A1I0ZKZ4_9BACT|nr:hypothetical protein [Algoriphagus aquimarinus]SFB26325.1 hypothetical protein SAMN04489723_106170 [Algoriphagus aquimarinus]